VGWAAGQHFIFEEVHFTLFLQDIMNAHWYFQVGRAGNGTRTRDINLGKVALYQLSYSRKSLILSTVYLGLPLTVTGSSQYIKILQ
jgi:hypothetical protein